MQEPNNKILDWWTFIHSLVGFTIGGTKISRGNAYLLIMGYEIVENVIARKTLGDFFKEYEGVLNMISDMVFGLGGYELGMRYGDKKV